MPVDSGGRFQQHAPVAWLLAHLRANVVAYLALFFALSAGAYAAQDKFLAPQNSVSSKSIRNGAVKKADLGKEAVDSKNLAKGAVRGNNLAANSVGAAQIEAGAVSSGEIADGGIQFGDLAPPAQPDRDLDLIEVGPIPVDDAPGGNPTHTVMLQHGPFTWRAGCQDNGGSVTVSYDLTATEAGHVNTSSASPDRFEANVLRQLTGNAVISANNTGSGGGYALTDGGHFNSISIFVVARPSGSTADCVFHVTGFGG